MSVESRWVRGGSWSHHSDFARLAFRLSLLVYFRYDGLGFRLVLRRLK